MQIGDIVYCKHKFLITGYNLEREVITISLIKDDELIDELIVPMYLGDLGIYPPNIDYCYPGQYLKKDHPDYYVPHPKDANTVIYRNKSFTIRVDRDFTYTGKYYLQPVNNGSLLVRHAELRTLEERISSLEAMKDQVFSGAELSGNVVGFVQRDSLGDFIKFLDTIGTTVRNTGLLTKTPIFAVIHDISTHVEYELMVTYLKTKSKYLWNS